MDKETLLSLGFKNPYADSEFVFSNGDKSFIVELNNKACYYTAGEGCQLSDNIEDSDRLKEIAWALYRIKI